MPMSRRMQQAASHTNSLWWSGLTNIVAVYQPKGATSLVDSYINLANPGTNDATVASGTPNWSSALGWIGNNFALSTGWIPPNEQVSVIVRYANAGGGVASFFGEFPSISIYAYVDLAGSLNYYNTGNLTVSPGLLTGTIAISGKSAYRNGLFDGTIPAGSGIGINELWLMAINHNGVMIQPETGEIMAVAICSTLQTAGQIAATTTKMSAL